MVTAALDHRSGADRAHGPHGQVIGPVAPQLGEHDGAAGGRHGDRRRTPELVVGPVPGDLVRRDRRRALIRGRGPGDRGRGGLVRPSTVLTAVGDGGSAAGRTGRVRQQVGRAEPIGDLARGRGSTSCRRVLRGGETRLALQHPGDDPGHVRGRHRRTAVGPASRCRSRRTPRRDVHTRGEQVHAAAVVGEGGPPVGAVGGGDGDRRRRPSRAVPSTRCRPSLPAATTTGIPRGDRRLPPQRPAPSDGASTEAQVDHRRTGGLVLDRPVESRRSRRCRSPLLGSPAPGPGRHGLPWPPRTSGRR